MRQRGGVCFLSFSPSPPFSLSPLSLSLFSWSPHPPHRAGLTHPAPFSAQRRLGFSAGERSGEAKAPLWFSSSSIFLLCCLVSFALVVRLGFRLPLSATSITCWAHKRRQKTLARQKSTVVHQHAPPVPQSTPLPFGSRRGAVDDNGQGDDSAAVNDGALCRMRRQTHSPPFLRTVPHPRPPRPILSTHCPGPGNDDHESGAQARAPRRLHALWRPHPHVPARHHLPPQRRGGCGV